MAQKFNDGQTFGEIRQILNDNADEINANATAASDAKTIAEQLAGNNTAGRAISTSTKTSNPVVIPGNISFNQGMGITNVKKLNTGARLTDFIESDVDVLWFLKGVYAGAWKTGTLNGIAFLGPNGIIAFDYDTCEMWIYGASRKWQKAGDADYTLPVASANTLGGIKIGAGLTTATDGSTRIADNVYLPGTPTAETSVLNVDTSDAPSDAIMTYKNFMDSERRCTSAKSPSNHEVFSLVLTDNTSSQYIDIYPYKQGFFQEYSVIFSPTGTNFQFFIRRKSDQSIKLLTVAGLTTDTIYRLRIIQAGVNYSVEIFYSVEKLTYIS